MSGVFKSVKKIFRQVGEFVKKYWKPIVLAAAVYFGGAYLMSAMGGSTAAAATQVGTSATHAGQVWRNAISSMLSGGGATASASAYADAVYKSKNLAVSNQVVAGTSAVKGIRFMRDERGITTFNSQHIEDASQLGYEAMDVYRNNVTQGSVLATTKTYEFLAKKFEQTRTAVGATVMEGTTLGQIPTLASAESAVTQPPTAEGAVSSVTEPVSQEVTTAGGPPAAGMELGGGFSEAEARSLGGETVVGTERKTLIEDHKESGIADIISTMLQGQTEQGIRDSELAKQNATANKISLGIQGAGVLLSAWGEYEKGKAASRIRNKKIPEEWKKPGAFPRLKWKGLKA